MGQKRLLGKIDITDSASTDYKSSRQFTGTYILSANVSNGDTVTIGSKVYTWQSTLTNVDGNVHIGASASASINNLIDAINLGSGAGTDYATAMTLNAAKTTATTGLGDIMVLYDTNNIIITTTETGTNSSWHAADTDYTLTNAVDFVTCVYDESTDLVECYDVPFSDLGTGSQGFSGDYDTSQNYTSSQLFEMGSGDFTLPLGCWATAEGKLYVTDEQDDKVYVYNWNTGEALPDEDFGSGTMVAPTGIYIIESTSKAYIVNSGVANEVQVWNIDTGAAVATEDFGSGTLVNPYGIFIVESTSKAYITDDVGANFEVKVFDITDSTEVSPSESFGGATLGSAAKNIYIYNDNDRAYIPDVTDDTIYVFKVSTGAVQSSEEINIANLFPNDITVDEANDRLYISRLSGSTNDVLVFDISTPTSPIPITTEAIKPSTTLSPTGIHKQGNNLFVCASGGSTAIVRVSLATFPATLIYPRAKDFESPNKGTYWTRSIEGYTTRQGNDYVYFKRFTSPPYFLAQSIPISEIVDEELPYDLEANITGYTEPTGKSTADGSITITATGDNTPFSYGIIGGNNLTENEQASGTFSNLNSGVYNFRVIDSNLVSVDLPPFNLTYTVDVFSTYGPLYDFTWYDITGTRQYKLEVVKKGYSGATTTLDKMAVNPFTLSTRGEGGDIYDTTILSLNATINFMDEAMFTYIAIAEGSDTDYGLIFYEESTGYQERWRGLISPRSYSEKLTSIGHVTSFTATDRTGDLKGLDYLVELPSSAAFVNTPDKAFYGGKKTLLQILHFCMRQVSLEMGYRVALGKFEDAHTKTSGNTALEQTLVDTDTYFEDDKSWKLDKVVKAILEPFNAMMFGFNGFWYIIDKQLLIESSVPYVEFDKTATQTGTGSWSPIIDFKGTNQATRFRWIDSPTISTTEVYKDVQLTLDAKVKPSLTSEFKGKNVKTGPYFSFEGLNNVLLSKGNDIRTYVLDENGQTISTSDIRGYAFTWGGAVVDRGPSKLTKPIQISVWMWDNLNSNTYFVHSKNIQSGASDKLKLNLDLDVYTFASQVSTNAEIPSIPTPYIPLKWQLKVGLLYYKASSDTWEKTAVTNQLFVDTDNKTYELLISASDTASATNAYTLKVYVPTVWEYDVTSTTKNGMYGTGSGTGVRGITTTSLPNGTRTIARYSTDSSNYYYYFYELLEEEESGSEPNVLTPDDYDASTNDKRWVLAVGKVKVNTMISIATFKNLELKFLPNGDEPPEEFLVTKNANLGNLLTLEKTLHHFDVPPKTNNANGIYFNHFFTGTNTITSSWYTTTGLKRRIQDHLLEWLVRLTKKTRYRVSGSIHYDTSIFPINVLRDPDDDNRKYLQLGVTYNFKDNKINGEFVEVTNDTIETDTLTGFTTAFDSDQTQ